jgi:hypothetical protein
MSELGPQAKALLDAALDGDEPTPEERARVRTAIAANLAVGAAAVGQSAAAAKTAAAGAVGAGSAAAGTGTAVGIAAKAVLSLTLVSAVGAGTTLYVRSSSSHREARPPTVPSFVQTASPGGRSLPPEVAAPVAAPAMATTSLESSKPSAKPLASAAAPPSVVHAHTRSTSSDVEAEVLLIGEAHRALQSGNASGALVMLDEHARRYPAGALGEERDAARIAALCALGRVAEGRDAADRFLREFPSSPLAARVRTSCGAASAPTF